MLVHHWYMDNWPAWRVTSPRTAFDENEKRDAALSGVPAE
jgi:hypothetical protein